MRGGGGLEVWHPLDAYLGVTCLAGWTIIVGMDAYKVNKTFWVGLLLLFLAAGLAGPPLAGAQGDDEPVRFCLWLLWSSDQKVILEADRLVKKGEKFALVARRMVGAHPQTTRSSLDCVGVEKLVPKLFEVAYRLKIGQVSRPFRISRGYALVMRTTDRYRRRGKLLYEARRYKLAEQQLLKDLALHPDSAAVWHLVALCRAARGDQKGALEALEQALTWAPGDAGILQDKATALVYLGRVKEAIPLYEQALKRSPGNPVIMGNLAWALALARQDLDRALELALEAVKAAPKRGRLWQTLGLVRRARGELQKALAAYRRAQKLQPGLPGLQQALRELQGGSQGNSPPAAPRQVARPMPAPQQAAKPAAKPAPAPAKAKAKPVAESQPATKAPPAEAAVKPAAKPRPVAKPKPVAKPRPIVKAKAAAKPVPAPKAKPKAEAKAAPKPKPRHATAPQPAVKPRPKPRPQTAVKAPAGQAIFLQVGSYRLPEVARKAIRRLRRAGHAPWFWLWRDAKGRRWTVLYLGPFKSVSAAAGLGRRLKKWRVIDSYRVRIRPADFLRRKGASFAGAGGRAKAAAPPPVRSKTAPRGKAAPRTKALSRPASSPAAPAAASVAPAAEPALPKDDTRPVFVVASVHRDLAHAYKQVLRWKRRGYRARVSPWPQPDGRVLQRVLLGPFPGGWRALQEAHKLQERGLVKNYELLVPEPLGLRLREKR